MIEVDGYYCARHHGLSPAEDMTCPRYTGDTSCVLRGPLFYTLPGDLLAAAEGLQERRPAPSSPPEVWDAWAEEVLAQGTGQGETREEMELFISIAQSRPA